MTHPLQTNAWEEFRKAWGNETVRIDGNLSRSDKLCLLTLHNIPFLNKKIGIFEKGPAPTKKILDGLKDFGKKNNLIFIKLEPNTEKSESLISLLRAEGAIKGKTLFTPTTFQINLTKSEDELMKSFSSKTRYNIRLAERKGVTIVEDNSEIAFNKYIELMRETVTRQKFYAHNEKYHRLMWKTLHSAGIAHLLTAKFNNKIIAAWILFAHDDFLYYPYGASSSNPNDYRLMPSGLLMWEAIKFGKKLGLKTFDLWGREANKGFTKFKEGYSPKVVEFLGTWDLVINKKYYFLYRVMDSFRWQFLRLKSKFIKPSF